MSNDKEQSRGAVESLPVLIFGTGGGAKDIYYWIKQCNRTPEFNGRVFQVVGFVSEAFEEKGRIVADGVKVVACDDEIGDIASGYKQLGAVLSFGFPHIKEAVYSKIGKYSNIIFPTIIHPSVIYDKDAGSMGQGNVVGAGTIIASEFCIGDFNYISINATLGHDIKIGSFNAINPMATISGNVRIGNRCLIGAGSTVLQELFVADEVTLGAGAVLTKDARENALMVGVPAKEGLKVKENKKMIKKNVFIIAEAGVNHNGSIDLAKKMIDAAKEAGADAVKFQTFKAEDGVSRFAPKANYQKETTNAQESQLEMVKKLELSYEQFEELEVYCKEKGILFLSTPFDLASIDFLARLDLPLWKVPSGEITNVPYLIRIAKTGKPVIMSTGMCTIEEISFAVNLLKENGAGEISLLHCNTEYPTSYEDVNLRAMDALKKYFMCPVGYSDHTLGIEVPVAAVTLGATIIEKHFTLDKRMEGPDHRASLEPAELEKMVSAIRNVEKAMGSGGKRPSESELKNRQIARKSIVAKKNIQAGEAFSEENITTKRPGTGISAIRWFDVIGQAAKKDFTEDELIEI